MIFMVFNLSRGAIGNNAPSYFKPQSLNDVVNIGNFVLAKHKVTPDPTFIVEKSEDTLVLEVMDSHVYAHALIFKRNALICHFDGLWPSAKELHDWLNHTSTTEYELLLCSKGFSPSPWRMQQIVKRSSLKDPGSQAKMASLFNHGSHSLTQLP